MSSILSRIAAIGIIAGGFAVTGDLGKLAKRGLDVVNSRDVPTARPEESVSSPAETALADAANHEVEQIVATAEAIAGGNPPQNSTPPGAPLGKAVIARDADFRPPQHGIDTIEFSSLAAGNRIVVWLAMPRRSGGRAYRCLVFDVVDPAGLELTLGQVQIPGLPRERPGGRHVVESVGAPVDEFAELDGIPDERAGLRVVAAADGQLDHPLIGLVEILEAFPLPLFGLVAQ